MQLGIDASNIRSGGGVTYLASLLGAATPENYQIRQIIVWAGRSTLGSIPDRPWICKIHEPLLDQSLPYRLFWQLCILPRRIRKAQCDLLYVPGSYFLGTFRPFVTISRNMLPFEWNEMRRYGLSWQIIRIALLRVVQSYSFRKADGVIFLTRFAQDKVTKVINAHPKNEAIVPHGWHTTFETAPREQMAISNYSAERPIRILYVSTIDIYKHQWHVAEAVADMRRREGYPVVLDLVGPALRSPLKRLRETLGRVDPRSHFIRYSGPVPHAELNRLYETADIFLFASSCENMSNILLEAMAAGLPIACSNRGSMPEVLGDAGVYFDPEKPEDIVRALKELIDSPALRFQKATAAFERAKAFSWQRCAGETFNFISVCYSKQSS